MLLKEISQPTTRFYLYTKEGT